MSVPEGPKASSSGCAKSILEYVEEGYLPESLTNFLALLGWAPKDDKELFSLEELIKEFSLERLNKNSPIFNIQKLDWFNGQWLRKMDDSNLAQKIVKQFPQHPKEEIKNGNNCFSICHIL